ncbi:NAD(P)-dependent oxidoreductase [Subtercola lobariae]|uniref:3-hydroxyisobutyrate dehydrogenase n=1 Tax=Subtercola lobariae TaxID=1588641 RepID=A0A917B683_9MICO|nr:NAD(P)-binding domain-containing protein [Subtercola lobariae]GGF21560.1 3-hydroxyisobutyrate dehydrogenase [Subtercola lobariae]
MAAVGRPGGAPDAASIGSIGVLGAGRMGLPIAVNLAAAGYEVTAFDVNSARDAALDAAAIRRSPGIRALCRDSDLLITVLPGAPELGQAMAPDALLSYDAGAPPSRGGGALAAMRPGAIWLDLTSGDPRMAAELATVAAARGIGYVEAPMGGGVTAARDAALSFCVAGAEAAVARVRPVLAALGANVGASEPASIRYLGEQPGAGQTAKLLANLLWFGQSIAVTEALLLGQALGLDLATLRDTLAVSAGGSQFIDRHLGYLLRGDYLEDFGIGRVVEELQTVVALAGETGTPFELSAQVLRMHREALARFGAVGGELLAAKLLEQRAATTLRIADER